MSNIRITGDNIIVNPKSDDQAGWIQDHPLSTWQIQKIQKKKHKEYLQKIQDTFVTVEKIQQENKELRQRLQAVEDWIELNKVD